MANLSISGNYKAPLAMMRMVPDGPNHPSAPALRKIEEYVQSLEIPAEIVWGMNDPYFRKRTFYHTNFPMFDTEVSIFLGTPPELKLKALIEVFNIRSVISSFFVHKVSSKDR